MCRGQSLGLLGTSQSSCRSPRPANLLQLGVDFPLGTGGDYRDHGVEDLQTFLDFAFAEAIDAAVILGDGLADDLALRLCAALAGLLHPMNGLRIQRKRDFVGCHTSTILLPYRIGEIGSPDTVTNTWCRQGPALGVGISARRGLAAKLPV